MLPLYTSIRPCYPRTHCRHPHLGPPPNLQVEATVEEALAGGVWCDVAPHVPSILSLSDTAALLAKCKAVAAASSAGQAQVLSGTCVVAAAMLEGIKQQLLEAARTAAEEAHKAKKARAGGGGGAAAAAAKAAAAGASGKKAAVAAESDSDDDWDMGGRKGKKGKGGGKKGKGGGGGKATKGGGSSKPGGSSQAAPADPGTGGSVLSMDSLTQHVINLHPDTEAAGADGDLPAAIAAGETVAGAAPALPACLEAYSWPVADVAMCHAPRACRASSAAAVAGCMGG